jgi:hypothetical protein
VCYARKFYHLVGGLLWKWEMPKSGKVHMRCGAETWTWTKANTSKLMAADMKLFKRRRKLNGRGFKVKTPWEGKLTNNRR